MMDPIRAAAMWLLRTYDDRVVVDGTTPIAEGQASWLVGCRFAGSGDVPELPLAATLVVPKDGRDPFPASNSAPIDEALNVEPAAGDAGVERWRFRVNARGCVLAADAVMHGSQASALPWRAEDEQPGWWPRLLSVHFPDAVTTTHTTWSSAIETIGADGPGASAVLWLRRRFRDTEVTGHLLYAHNTEAGVLLLDPQRGVAAETRDDEVLELAVARFRRAAVDPVPVPWQEQAGEFDAAVRKATQWLDATYGGEAVLVAPSPEDELRRGWLFACTTRKFAETGDWEHQMLDSALVVPKDSGEPFGLPNDDPWTYLDSWDSGAEDLPRPPDTGDAAWFAPTMNALGPVRGAQHHLAWTDVLEQVSRLPDDMAAIVWLRRQDRRGRETVGNLFVAVNDDGNPAIVDSREPDSPPRMESSPLGLVVVTYRTVD